MKIRDFLLKLGIKPHPVYDDYLDYIKAQECKIRNFGLKKGQMYEHYKNKHLYTPIETALRESDKEPMVIYRCLESGATWVRPVSEFVEKFSEVVDDRS